MLRSPRTFGEIARVVGVGARQQDGESDHIRPALRHQHGRRRFGQPLLDLGFGIEIVGFVAQMEAGIGRQLRPQGLDGLQQIPRILRAAQARLPRPCRGMKNRGDAVSDRLLVAVDQGHIDRKIDAGGGASFVARTRRHAGRRFQAAPSGRGHRYRAIRAHGLIPRR